jgi:hypothetical protein
MRELIIQMKFLEIMIEQLLLALKGAKVQKKLELLELNL